MNDAEASERPVSPINATNVSSNSVGSTAPVTLNVGAPPPAAGTDSGKEEKKAADAQPSDAFMAAVLERLSRSMATMVEGAISRALAPLQQTATQQLQATAEQPGREQLGEPQRRVQTAADVQSTPVSVRRLPTARSIQATLDGRTPVQPRTPHAASRAVDEEPVDEEEEDSTSRSGQRPNGGELSKVQRLQLKGRHGHGEELPRARVPRGHGGRQGHDGDGLRAEGGDGHSGHDARPAPAGADRRARPPEWRRAGTG